MPCSKMKNCKNGGKTIIDLKNGPGSDPYKCKCLEQYEGDHCEYGEYFTRYFSAFAYRTPTQTTHRLTGYERVLDLKSTLANTTTKLKST